MQTQRRILKQKGPVQTQIRWFVGGFAVGLTAMYFLDPARGAYRRHVVRDRFFHLSRRTEDVALRAYRDFENRIRGSLYRWRHPLDPNVDDDILLGRIRSEFGKKITHAKSIVTEIHRGVVTLSGPVLASEVRPLIKSVKSVIGVKRVVNHLEVHQNPDHVSSLQGSGKPYLQ